MTVTESPAVAGAVETTKAVASHLHPVASFDLDDHPMPTGREEVWRFTPLKRLRGAPGATSAHSRTTRPWRRSDVRRLGRRGRRRRHRRRRARRRAAPRLVPGRPGRRRRVEEHREGAARLRCRPTSILDEPVHVVRHRHLARPAQQRRTTCSRSERTRASRSCSSTAAPACTPATSRCVVGDGAHVSVVSVQDWDDDAVHVGQHEARVGRAATYRHVGISFGGDVVRLNTTVRYDGPGGEAEMLGLYFADAGQHLEHRLFVDHNEPKTRSNVDYKGALQGKGAHAVWIGDVLIRKVAEGIETYESNRNLVLTDGCHADSVPNLEIETGEIEGAGHASTTGRFDDQQLFYLQSRGIHEDEARRLVVHGFFADIIRKIGVPQIEEKLLATVEAELEKNVMQAAAS